MKTRGSVGSNEQKQTTFEKVKMLRITTNLNEIVSAGNGHDEQPKNHSEKFGGFF